MCGISREIPRGYGPKFLGRSKPRGSILLWRSHLGSRRKNRYIESSNGQPRHERLNVNWFVKMQDARQKTAGRQCDYDETQTTERIAIPKPA
jgi:Integrase core domain